MLVYVRGCSFVALFGNNHQQRSSKATQNNNSQEPTISIHKNEKAGVRQDTAPAQQVCAAERAARAAETAPAQQNFMLGVQKPYLCNRMHTLPTKRQRLRSIMQSLWSINPTLRNTIQPLSFSPQQTEPTVQRIAEGGNGGATQMMQTPFQRSLNRGK